MKNYLTHLFLIAFIFTNAQHKFNDISFTVTQGDLTANEFVTDSTAKALVIYEEGNSYFNESLSILNTEIKRKVKVFDKNDSDVSTLEILLYKSDNRGNKEAIQNISATTHNLVNDEVVRVKLDRKDIFEEAYDDNHTIVKFTMPNIQNGSVITYSYTVESPFFYNYHGWDFQEEIPKLYSEYRTSIPANYDYNIKLVGTTSLAVNEAKIKNNCVEFGRGASADCTESRYVMKNIPAFIDEEYMTSRQNYLSSIQYELKSIENFDNTVKKFSKTWKDADKELKSKKSIGKQINKTSLVKNILTNELDGIDNTLDKAKQIFKYIQSNYTWNEEYQLFQDASLSETIKTKSGKVSEINLLLLNLLNAHDIEAKPVLLATRNTGIPTKLYPVISEFNYLIVHININDNTYLLDATDKYVSFGELPFRCLNYFGRLLDFKDGSYWVDLTPNENTNVIHRLDLKLGKDNLTGTINSKYNGHKASPKKKAYFSSKDSYLDNYINHYNFEIIDHVVKTEPDTDNLFEEEFNIEYTEFNETEDRLFLNPFLIKFFTENPFKLQERTYPIEFGYSNTFSYTAQFDLGENYEVIGLPEAYSIGLPDNSASISFNPTVSENKLIIVFKITLKSAIYTPESYNYLKQFFNTIVNTQTKTLIELKRK